MSSPIQPVNKICIFAHLIVLILYLNILKLRLYKMQTLITESPFLTSEFLFQDTFYDHFDNRISLGNLFLLKIHH